MAELISDCYLLKNLGRPILSHQRSRSHRKSRSRHILNGRLSQIDREISRSPDKCSRSSSRRPSSYFLPPKKQITPVLPYRKERSLVKHKFLIIPKPKPVPQCVDADWAGSQLDTFVCLGQFKFNWQKDPEIYSAAQIYKYLKPQTMTPRPAEVIDKARRTIDKLSEELMFNKHAKDFPKYKITLKSLYKTCRQLLDIRVLTVNVLIYIHEKEKLVASLERIQRSDVDRISQCFQKIKLLSSKIQTLIGNWKDLNVPYQKFIYQSKDYSEKIDEDSNTLLLKLKSLISDKN